MLLDGLSGGWFASIRPTHLQPPSFDCSRCPSTAGSVHVSLTGKSRLKNRISRCFSHVPMYPDLQRYTEILSCGRTFVRQDTSSRMMKLFLFPSKTSPSVGFWSWCYCLFFPSDQKGIFNSNPFPLGKFITMGNDKSFRECTKDAYFTLV